MAYGRVKPGLPWHVMDGYGKRTLCNVQIVGERARFAKELKQGERTCKNCASLNSQTSNVPDVGKNP